MAASKMRRENPIVFCEGEKRVKKTCSLHRQSPQSIAWSQEENAQIPQGLKAKH